MLLDVDGVLNVLGDNRHTVRIGKDQYPGGYPFWPRAFTKPFMVWAWKNFNVYWLTSWGGRANLIADWAWQTSRPVVSDLGSRYEDWKLGAVIHHFGLHRSRKIVWVEDEFHIQTRRWAALKSNVLLVKTNHRNGVLPEHVKKIENFLRFH
jgi:hypothetical protein